MQVKMQWWLYNNDCVVTIQYTVGQGRDDDKTAKDDFPVRMTSYHHQKLQQQQQLHHLQESNNNNHILSKFTPSPALFRKKMNAEKRLAQVEQELLCKNEEIRQLQEAIKQMPEFANLEGMFKYVHCKVSI